MSNAIEKKKTTYSDRLNQLRADKYFSHFLMYCFMTAVPCLSVVAATIYGAVELGQEYGALGVFPTIGAFIFLGFMWAWIYTGSKVK